MRALSLSVIDLPHMDLLDHMLVVVVVDIAVNNSVGVVDKGPRDIVAVRIGQIVRPVDHMVVNEETDKIDFEVPHLSTPYRMDLYCN